MIHDDRKWSNEKLQTTCKVHVVLKWETAHVRAKLSLRGGGGGRDKLPKVEEANIKSR